MENGLFINPINIFFFGNIHRYLCMTMYVYVFIYIYTCVKLQDGEYVYIYIEILILYVIPILPPPGVGSPHFSLQL